MAATASTIRSASKSTPNSGLRGSPTASRRLRVVPRSRLFASPGGVQATRSPLLLHLTHHAIYAGTVGQATAKQVVFLSTHPSTTASPSEYYRCYAPLIPQALELLGHDVKERRVVVIHDNGLQLNPACQQALERILLQDIGVPAVAFHASLQCVPMAVPSAPALLLVHWGATHVDCMAFAAGHALEFTLQQVRWNYFTTSNSTQEIITCLDWYRAQGQQRDALVRALLLCLQACPREARKSIVNHLFFCGSVIQPQRLAVQVAKSLRQVLQDGWSTSKDEQPPGSAPSSAPDSPSSDAGPSPSPELPQHDPDQGPQLPIALSELKPLASHVSVITMDRISPQLVPWFGASIWANHWHGVDPDADCFQWKRGAAV